jgi:hypothetical protein
VKNDQKKKDGIFERLEFFLLNWFYLDY